MVHPMACKSLSLACSMTRRKRISNRAATAFASSSKSSPPLRRLLLIHCQILYSIWRPLISRINDDALAVCDRRTTFDSDWETVEKVQPQWIEESMYPRWNDKHEWFCLKGQTKDEALAFVVWDSDRAQELRGMEQTLYHHTVTRH